MTENYFIIIEQPLTVSVGKMIIGKYFNQSFSKYLYWNDNEPTLIHVIDKRNGDFFKTFKAPTFFFMHTINAFEKSGNVLLDLCAFRDASIIDFLYVESIRNQSYTPSFAEGMRSRALRFTIPIENDHSSNDLECPETLSDIGCELPRLNDDFGGYFCKIL